MINFVPDNVVLTRLDLVDDPNGYQFIWRCSGNNRWCCGIEDQSCCNSSTAKFAIPGAVDIFRPGKIVTSTPPADASSSFSSPTGTSSSQVPPSTTPQSSDNSGEGNNASTTANAPNLGLVLGLGLGLGLSLLVCVIILIFLLLRKGRTTSTPESQPHLVPLDSTGTTGPDEYKGSPGPTMSSSAAPPPSGHMMMAAYPTSYTSVPKELMGNQPPQELALTSPQSQSPSEGTQTAYGNGVAGPSHVTYYTDEYGSHERGSVALPGSLNQDQVSPATYSGAGASGVQQHW
jgi:hypothetical protein